MPPVRRPNHKPPRGLPGPGGPAVPELLEAAPSATTPLRVRCSLQRGKPRRSGIRADAYHWRDLLDGAPPRRKARGSSAYVLYLGTEEGPDVQVSYSTILRVDPGADVASPLDDVVHVEERVTVQRRALHEMIDRQHAFVDRVTLAWRAKLAARHARHRRALLRVRVRWLAAALLWVVQAEARAWNAVWEATRRALLAPVHVPDRLLTRSRTAALHLQTRSGRRSLRMAVVDPGNATPQEKSIVLLLAVGFLLFFVLVASNFVALAFTGAAEAYQRLVGDFTAAVLSVLALPIPLEPLLILSVLALGPVLGAAGLLLGKVVGSWMLYLLGDTLFDEVERKTAGRPRVKRVTDWMRAKADKSGFWLLAVINAVPFVPDLLVYVFAVSGMRYRGYLGGILVGTLLKFGAIILGVHFVGPERVQEVLDHPFRALTGG